MRAARAAVVEKLQTAQLGFWLYLMTDIMLFASLFATYMVLRRNIAGGPSAADIFDPQYALIETIILLTSSFTCGLALLAARLQKKTAALSLLASTILLGVGFLALELREFQTFVAEGHTWQISAFLSSFFTLVGTHGAHIAIGLLWAAAIGLYVAIHGTTNDAIRKFTLFALFWHFLDIVWIFIFTVVYLLGGVS